MRRSTSMLLTVAFTLALVLLSIAVANAERQTAPTLAEHVRRVTAPFKDVKAAEVAGYGLFHGCTSGQQEGAMGIHYANGAFVADGKIEVEHPETLLYEPRDGRLQLVGVEYLVDAAAWNKDNDGPPVLFGQLFNFVGAPNRYGLEPFYELHVWAWQSNPNGVFADWNPRVSCAEYVGPAAHH